MNCRKGKVACFSVKTGGFTPCGVAHSGGFTYDAADASFGTTFAAAMPRQGCRKQIRIEDWQICRDLAARLCRAGQANAILAMLVGPTDWEKLLQQVEGLTAVVAADSAEDLAGAAEAGLATIVLDMEDSPVIEKLTQALL